MLKLGLNYYKTIYIFKERRLKLLAQSSRRPPINPEIKESQMIGLAIDLAEQQLREGTASSQVITHFLKLGSSTERLEKRIKEKQAELMEAKKEHLQSIEKMEALYKEAMAAMAVYNGDAQYETQDIPTTYDE